MVKIITIINGMEYTKEKGIRRKNILMKEYLKEVMEMKGIFQLQVNNIQNL